MNITKHDLKEILKKMPDDAMIAVNSIYQDNEWQLSPVAECHYDEKRNALCITPEEISI